MASNDKLKTTLDRILAIFEAAIPKRIDDIIKKNADSIVKRIKENLETQAKKVSDEMLKDFKLKLKDDINNANLQQIEQVFTDNVKDILQKMTIQPTIKGGSRKNRYRKSNNTKKTKRGYKNNTKKLR